MAKQGQQRTSLFSHFMAKFVTNTCLYTLFLLSTTNTANANDGQLRFRADVPARCGIEVIDAEGELAFGQEYNLREIRLRLIHNVPHGSIMLRLKSADFGELESGLTSNHFRFQVDVPQRYEGDIDYWRSGVQIDKAQLNSDQIIEIRARVDIDESMAPAGDHLMRLDWESLCVR